VTLLSGFCQRLDRLLHDTHPEWVCLAVSGGGDSMALLHLAAGWARDRETRLAAVTVDHGLRPESAEEAALVARAAADLGIPHQTLNWTGWDGRGNLQHAARTARRQLIEDWAGARDIGVVLTGHTSDDQAETVLMRLARGSGVDGLAGIAEVEVHRLTWMRPLLGQSRAGLRDFLREQGVAWAEDPSNDDLRFDRIKARQMMGHLAGLGLTVPRLTETAAHMRQARIVLDRAMRELAEQAVAQVQGDLLIERAAFDAAPRETRTRLLAGALMWVSGNPYRPRYAPLSALADTGSGTLHGCQVIDADGCLRVVREYQAVRDIRCETSALWDDRWRLIGPHHPGLHIGALGPDGARQCADRAGTGPPHLSLIASPAIWQGTRLIAAPIAGFLNGWRAELAQSRADYVDSLKSH